MVQRFSHAFRIQKNRTRGLLWYISGPPGNNAHTFCNIPALFIKDKLLLTCPHPLCLSIWSPTSPEYQVLPCKWRLNLTPLAAELEFRLRSEATASIFGIPRPMTKLFIYKGWLERLCNYLKYEDGLNLCSSNSIYLIDPAEADGT